MLSKFSLRYTVMMTAFQWLFVFINLKFLFCQFDSELALYVVIKYIQVILMHKL